MTVSARFESTVIQPLYHGLPGVPPAGFPVVPVWVAQSGGGPPGGTLAMASAHRFARSVRSVSVACLTSSGVSVVSPRGGGSLNSDGYVPDDDDDAQADSSAVMAAAATAAHMRLRVSRANVIQACPQPSLGGPFQPLSCCLGRPLARPCAFKSFTNPILTEAN